MQPTCSGEGTTASFQTVYQDGVIGQLTCFDGVILEGHLTALYLEGRLKGCLDSQGARPVASPAPLAQAASGPHALRTYATP